MEENKLKAKYEIMGNDLFIRLPGDLDCNIAQEIRDTADILVEENKVERIVFDFENTGFMDSTGIGVIIGRYKVMKVFKGTVEVINVSKNVGKLMYMAGLKKLVTIYEK